MAAKHVGIDLVIRDSFLLEQKNSEANGSIRNHVMKAMVAMLTHEKITESVEKVIEAFPIARVSYFSSYADGCASESSDLDILVECKTDALSLLTLLDIKYQLEDTLGISVDVIHAPIPEDSLRDINNEVLVYAA